ncbi:hypothetical protein Nepgr_027410 [Nepenthes gracilis]|uniref:Uncharacterized protein n=1 Tax=Nepenthes gracilis TaxID=150966 RepID=A0AAD3TA09_NEPGR|nr:hypothetical protein Nepgr_027410 [Nepenthes gracilis]
MGCRQVRLEGLLEDILRVITVCQVHLDIKVSPINQRERRQRLESHLEECTQTCHLIIEVYASLLDADDFSGSGDA